MSGGAGTRLWPLSTEAHPKQRLRCAADFFASLFATRRREVRRFSYVLDLLLADTGRLENLAAQERLRDDFMRTWTDADAPAGPKTAQKALAMGFALGQQTPEKTALSRAVVKAGAKLAALERFWR